MNIKYCYNFKEINYNQGLFDNFVDATYIINLEDNGRINNIYNQINNYKPTKIVYILFNKGYKKCKKENYINTPPKDLVDAFITIFKHAKKENYNNILILEDDFIFNKKIKNRNIINKISEFINNKNNDFIYYLGCLPILQIPINYYNYRLFGSLGTHAIIYSKKFREKTLLINQKNIIDWDEHTKYKGTVKYNYKEPLCYQLFPDTENSKHWHIITRILRYFFKFLNLHIKQEPGYTILYLISKLYIFIFYIIMINMIFNKIIYNYN